MKHTVEEVRERVARAICAGCGENPDHLGDARGNDYRWQDYLDAADAAIDAHITQPAQSVDIKAIREVIAYLKKGHRFDAEMADKLTAALPELKP